MAEQIYSMTEWMQEIKKHFGTEVNLQLAIDEDLGKFSRLAKLNKEVGIPIDLPIEIPVEEFLYCGKNLERFFVENCKSGKYSIKAQPLEQFKQTHFRNRMHNISQEEAIQFVRNLKPNPLHYSVQIWEYFDLTAGGIFVVMEKGIYGEFTTNRHFFLTQGLETPVKCFFDFEMDKLEITNRNMKKIALDAFNIVKTNNSNYQTAHGFLKGYFEFIYYHDGGYRFIDYNTTSVMNNIHNIEVNKGNIASPGNANGIARHIKSEADFTKFHNGDILIAEFTDPHFVPIMAKASAIITTKGGLLSHAAIVARELKKPCLVGIKNAFEQFKDGDKIEVDAKSGIVKRLLTPLL